MSSFLNRLAGLIYPPRCAACGKIIPLYSAQRTFCAECAEWWSCERMIRIVEAKYSKGTPVQIITAAPYDTRRNSGGIGKAVILGLKSHPVASSANFVAEQIYSALAWLNLPRNTVITWVPRSKKGLRDNGYDQTKLIAKKLSRISGLKTERFLIHKGETVQKNMHGKDRLKNAQRSYGIFERNRGCIQGKDILLIDDVVASGATLDTCAKLLTSAGAHRVFCAAFAGRIDSV